MVSPALVYHYIVPEKEFGRYPAFHYKLGDELFTDELVRVGWTRRSEDGICFCDRKKVCVAEFHYCLKGNHIIEYVASEFENHPWLRGKSDFFKDQNV